MRTAIGAPDPGDFERNQPHNLFNDRRIGGKAKNRAVGESVSVPRKKAKQNKRDAMDAQHGEWYADNELDKKIKNRFSNERDR
jgi:hypothetical protein